MIHSLVTQSIIRYIEDTYAELEINTDLVM